MSAGIFLNNIKSDKDSLKIKSISNLLKVETLSLEGANLSASIKRCFSHFITLKLILCHLREQNAFNFANLMKFDKCEIYVEAKYVQQPFKQVTGRVSEPLDLIHSDLAD